MNSQIIRRVRATGLTVTVYSRNQENVLGVMEGVKWFEDVKQVKGLSGDPWQDVSSNVQLSGRLTDAMLKKVGLFGESEVWVCFEFNGMPFSGPVLIATQSNEHVVMHVQGGYEQEQDRGH